MTMMRLQLVLLSLLASLGHSFRPAIVSPSHTHTSRLWVSQLPCTDDIACVSKNNDDDDNLNNNEPSLDHVVPPLLLMGGDFVGLWLTANPRNGAIRPVPEHWVPEALLEWGQEPYALEIIVSEDDDDNNNDNNNNADSTTRRPHWQRRTLTILPETGCGVDNLEVVPRHDRDLQPIRVQKQHTAAAATAATAAEKDLATVCLISRLPNQMLALETILPDDDDDEHRVRLVVTLKTTTTTSTDHDSSSSSLAIASVGLAWERRLDTVSSRGTRADGGGLDGQSVSRWMGETIRRAASSLHQVPSKQAHTSHNDDDGNIAWVRLPRHLSYALQQSFSNDDEDSDTTTLTIRHGANNDETRETVVVWSIVGNGGEDVSCVVQ